MMLAEELVETQEELDSGCNAGVGVGILLPTYQESANILPLIDRIREILPASDILVVDDNSPDGTWHLVETRSEDDPRLHLIRRTWARGRGSAGIAGFAQLMKNRDLQWIVEMDADFSHDPSHIPALLQALNVADVAIGSRYTLGGSDAERGWLRQRISLFANAWSRRVLGLTILDTTSGFRAFTRQALEVIGVNTLSSVGPTIVAEVLWRAHKNDLKIQEVPIRFQERVKGESQLSLKILVIGFLYILKLRLKG